MLQIIFIQNDQLLNVTKDVPGNTNYIDVVKEVRKAYIFRTSSIKGIRRNEFNYYSKIFYPDVESYPGATLNDLKHNIQFPLQRNTSDIVILHCNSTCWL